MFVRDFPKALLLSVAAAGGCCCAGGCVLCGELRLHAACVQFVYSHVFRIRAHTAHEFVVQPHVLLLSVCAQMQPDDAATVSCMACRMCAFLSHVLLLCKKGYIIATVRIYERIRIAKNMHTHNIKMLLARCVGAEK